jgi:hypothetical protein
LTGRRKIVSLQSVQKNRVLFKPLAEKKSPKKSKIKALKFGRDKKPLTFATPNDKSERKGRRKRGQIIDNKFFTEVFK